MNTSHLLVDIDCKNQLTRFASPSLEVTIQDDSTVVEEQTSRRRLATQFESVSKVWTNSMKSVSHPVTNLFNKNYDSYWEVRDMLKGESKTNDVCVDLAKCTKVTSFWLYIPLSEMPAPNTKLGDVTVSS
jgi:hypothetical protein